MLESEAVLCLLQRGVGKVVVWNRYGLTKFTATMGSMI